MPDYDKPTGTRGTMRITDDGTVVSFWLSCSDPATTVGNLVWSGVVNGAGVGGSRALPANFGAVQLGVWAVSAAQRVTFHINGTGTQGLGGPTDHYADIVRGAPAPTPPVSPVTADRVYDVKADRATLQFAWPGNGNTGGSPLTGFQTTWARDPGFTVGVGSVDTVGQPSYLTGLAPGSDYWVAVRAKNALGYGPYGNVLTFKTLTGCYVSDGVNWLPAAVLADPDGASWLPAELLYDNDNASWKPAG